MLTEDYFLGVPSAIGYDPADSVTPDVDPKPSKTGGEPQVIVLVLEDDPILRSLLTEQLESVECGRWRSIRSPPLASS